MEKQLKSLVELSRLYGADPSYVIAGGGNTSWKNNEKIWIKASGISLATIDQSGFVSLSREKLHLIAEKNYSDDPLLREQEVKEDLHAAIVEPKNLRPSVETSLHEVIGYSYVIHTHPTLVNGLMCSNGAEAVCRKLFGDKVLFVPYTDPGYILFKKVSDAILKFRKAQGTDPQIIFLENHGVFVGADTPEEIIQLYKQLMGLIAGQVMNTMPPVQRVLLDESVTGRALTWHPGYAAFTATGITSGLVGFFDGSMARFSRASTAFTPDDIVYCKAHYLYVPAADSATEQDILASGLVEDYRVRYGYFPKVLVLQGTGAIGVEENLKAAGNVLDVFENILKISFLSENFGGPKFLNDQQIAFIDNWEVENYRRKVAKS